MARAFYWVPESRHEVECFAVLAARYRSSVFRQARGMQHDAAKIPRGSLHGGESDLLHQGSDLLRHQKARNRTGQIRVGLAVAGNRRTHVRQDLSEIKPEQSSHGSPARLRK